MKMMTKWSSYPLSGVVRPKRVRRFLRALSEALLLLLRLRGRRRTDATAIYRSRAYLPPSHVLPIQDDVEEGMYKTHDALFYYDSSWNSACFAAADDVMADGEDEEAEVAQGKHVECAEAGEIDRLADVFIASFHEKFRLEKQESYRLFQEMLARGV